MMQPCKDGAAGNHGSSLKRCDSPPAPQSSAHVTIVLHHPLQLRASL